MRQTGAGECVAVAGKALRRAGTKGQSPRYLVRAWASANRLVSRWLTAGRAGS